MKKYTSGLLYGRFQPFHKGHLYLMKKVLQDVENLVIGVGSANVHDNYNIFDYQTRRKILELVIKNEKLTDKIQAIVPLDDIPDDTLWLKEVLRKVARFDVVVGNNDWTNGIFQKAGYTIMRVPYYKRYVYEGIKIRNLMKKHREWENRVPIYLVPIINEALKIQA